MVLHAAGNSPLYPQETQDQRTLVLHQTNLARLSAWWDGGRSSQTREGQFHLLQKAKYPFSPNELCTDTTDHNVHAPSSTYVHPQGPRRYSQTQGTSRIRCCFLGEMLTTKMPVLPGREGQKSHTGKHLTCPPPTQRGVTHQCWTSDAQPMGTEVHFKMLSSRDREVSLWLFSLAVLDAWAGAPNSCQ